MIYQFKIQLKGISKPPVWRRFKLSGIMSLHRLHEVIQAAFGWENYHMYQFSPKGWGSTPNYTINEEGDDVFQADEDSREHSVQDVFIGKGQKMIYIYDFGDDWQHQITVEEIEEGDLLRPSLMAGKGACPPEDCGGAWGYTSLKDNEEVDQDDFDLQDAIIDFNDYLDDKHL